MKTTHFSFLFFLWALFLAKPLLACDNTPLLVVYDPVEIAGGQWNLDVFVCFGSEESQDGFTLESTDGSLVILNATPSQIENPYNGNFANALFSGGVLNYYYDNSDGSNFNDADGETGPCIDFEITVDSDPTGSSFTMAGVNDGCPYTISDANLTAEVTFQPPCNATQSLIAPGIISGNTSNGSTLCNFRSDVFSTVKEEIVKVIVPCDGEYTFSLCGSSFDTWMAISYQCCFLPFASNNNYCGDRSELTVDLLAGTYYVLVEGFLWDDYGDYILNISASTDAVSISSIDISPAQCALNDAEITIHANGNDGPFSYSIDGGLNFFTDSVFSGLGAGNYTVIVQGQSSCLASSTISINTNPPLIIDGINGIPAACGLINGEISITVSSGTAPYQYSIDNGINYQLSSSFSSLEGGDYLISVIDVNGCEVNAPFTLESTSEPIIQDIIIQDASCGLATGQIEIIASGDAELTYSIDGINFQSSPIFSGLNAGIYPDLTVSSILGCFSDTSITLGDNGAPFFSQIILTNTDCDNSGGIEIIASGGGGGYSYSIDGGLNFSPINVFTGLISGPYNIAIIDTNLCIVDSTIYLDQNTSISIDGISITEPICDPGTGTISNNGEIDITASGGSASLEYSIDGGLNFQSGNLFTSLSYGAYMIIVSDGICSVDSLISLSSNPAPSIEILDARDLSCGEINGFIAVKVVNPSNPDYIYEFDNGIENIQSLPTTDDQYSYDLFTSGIWNVIVTDGDGCKADTVVVLDVIPDISISEVLIDSVDCGLNNGAFTIVATSGNLPIEYSFNGDFSTSQGNGYFSDLLAGNYTVYLRDERFCLDTVTIDLLNASGVLIDSLSISNPLCDAHNGEITIYASGGSEPYYYSIDNGLSFQTGNFFSGLNEGNYEIIVVDAASCVVTSTATLVASGGLIIATTTVPLHCGEMNGEIHMTASGGDGNYIYTIDNGSIQSNSSGIFTGLSSGIYLLNIVDQNGCSISGGVNLVTIAPPQIDSVTAGQDYCGEANGSLEIFVSNGSDPYQFSIDNGLIFQSTSLFESLNAGIYPIVISDSLNCTDSTSVEILSSAEFTISAILLNEAICGNNNGSAIIIVEDALPPLSYVLNGADTNTTGSFDNLSSGNYTIEVIDEQNCIVDSVFTLTDLLVPNPPALTMPDQQVCVASVEISANDPMGNTAIWTIIEGNASIVNPDDSVTMVQNLSMGDNVFVWTISNADCPPTSDTLLISRYNEITVDAGEDIYNYASVYVPLFASSDILGSFSWIPSSILSNPYIYNPVANVTESTQFIVSVNNDYGCYGRDTVWVYLVQDIEFASAFTPDGDGINDEWIINNIEFFPNSMITIMNRYGNTIFESKGYTTPWDGTFDGKDVPVASYFYVIDLGEGFETKTGSVSVIR